MKTLRIPETDLARISPLSKDEKRLALRRLHLGVPPFSYDPVKHSWGDILNMQPGMFGPAKATAWEEIEKAISRRSRPGVERDNNLSVAYALHQRAISDGWRSKQHDIYPLTLASGLKLEYWLRLVLVFDGRPLVPHFDPRRSNLRLSEVGRRFAFSVMHDGRALLIPTSPLQGWASSSSDYCRWRAAIAPAHGRWSCPGTLTTNSKRWSVTRMSCGAEVWKYAKPTPPSRIAWRKYADGVLRSSLRAPSQRPLHTTPQRCPIPSS